MVKAAWPIPAACWLTRIHVGLELMLLGQKLKHKASTKRSRHGLPCCLIAQLDRCFACLSVDHQIKELITLDTIRVPLNYKLLYLLVDKWVPKQTAHRWLRSTHRNRVLAQADQACDWQWQPHCHSLDIQSTGGSAIAQRHTTSCDTICSV
jgi:hypothetical protein